MAQTPLVERIRTGGFRVSTANGHRYIDRDVLAGGQAAVLYPGALLGKITASGKFTLLVPTAVDGSGTCAGILFARVDATLADTTCAVVVRATEVKSSELDYGILTTPQIVQATADLAALGIILR
jgi:hypothetical protein